MNNRRTIITLLSFLLMLCAMPAQAVTLDRIVAVVNDEVITWLELYESMRRDYAAGLKDMDAAQQSEFLTAQQRNYLEDLVLRRAQIQQARALGIAATDEEVQETAESIRNKYNLDEMAFRQALENEGMTWESYHQTLFEQITMGRLVERKVRSKVTREELPPLTGGTRYHLRQIFFPLTRNDEMPAIERTLAAIREALGRGEPFDLLAMRYSKGPNASNGGDLGTIEEGQLSEEFRTALTGVEPGHLTEPFVSSRGVHLVMLQSKMTAEEFAMEKMFQQKYGLWVQNVLETSRIDIRL